MTRAHVETKRGFSVLTTRDSSVRSFASSLVSSHAQVALSASLSASSLAATPDSATRKTTSVEALPSVAPPNTTSRAGVKTVGSSARPCASKGSPHAPAHKGTGCGKGCGPRGACLAVAQVDAAASARCAAASGAGSHARQPQEDDAQAAGFDRSGGPDLRGRAPFTHGS